MVAGTSSLWRLGGFNVAAGVAHTAEGSIGCGNKSGDMHKDLSRSLSGSCCFDFFVLFGPHIFVFFRALPCRWCHSAITTQFLCPRLHRAFHSWNVCVPAPTKPTHFWWVIWNDSNGSKSIWTRIKIVQDLAGLRMGRRQFCIWVAHIWIQKWKMNKSLPNCHDVRQRGHNQFEHEICGTVQSVWSQHVRLCQNGSTRGDWVLRLRGKTEWLLKLSLGRPTILCPSLKNIDALELIVCPLLFDTKVQIYFLFLRSWLNTSHTCVESTGKPKSVVLPPCVRFLLLVLCLTFSSFRTHLTSICKQNFLDNWKRNLSARTPRKHDRFWPFYLTKPIIVRASDANFLDLTHLHWSFCTKNKTNSYAWCKKAQNIFLHWTSFSLVLVGTLCSANGCFFAARLQARDDCKIVSTISNSLTTHLGPKLETSKSSATCQGNGTGRGKKTDHCLNVQTSQFPHWMSAVSGKSIEFQVDCLFSAVGMSHKVQHTLHWMSTRCFVPQGTRDISGENNLHL